MVGAADAELGHGVGAGFGPPGTGDFEYGLKEVAVGAFDQAGADRWAGAQGGEHDGDLTGFERVAVSLDNGLVAGSDGGEVIADMIQIQQVVALRLEAFDGLLGQPP